MRYAPGTKVKREGKMKTFRIKMVVFCLAMFFYATSSYSDLIYSTYLGGSDTDSYVSTAMTVDADGNVYVAGYTLSSDFPTTPGSVYESYNGSYANAFITKFDPTGKELLWSTYLGGSGTDICTAIAVDADENVYVAGYTRSANFPTTPGAYDISYNGSSDAFVTKLNPAGTEILWSTYLGGSGWESNANPTIAVDAERNVYITGATTSYDFPTTFGAYDTSRDGGDDAFVSKLNSTGMELIYSTYLGGSLGDRGHAIVVDSDGNLYVTGFTTSSDFPTTPGAYGSYDGSYMYVFVTKLNSTGTDLIYSTYLVGGGSFPANIGYGIAVDSDGNAYVTGEVGRGLPTTPGAYNTVGEAVFVTKLNPTGTDLVYSTYLTGEEPRGEPQPLVGGKGRAIAIDIDGNAYVVGNIYGEFPTTLGAHAASSSGGSVYGYGDAFITKLNSTGTGLIYSTYLGGSESDAAFAVAVDADGNILVVGATDSDDFPTTPDAYDTSHDGGGDVFITKIPILVGLIISNAGTAGSGTIDPEQGTSIFNEGTEVTITATPNSGYIFIGWSGDASGTNNPIIITMDSDKSITANFTAKSNGDGNGDGKKGGCFIATAAYGSQLHPHLDILRDFRDRYLMAKKFGRMLVSFYYKYSPFVAELIANNKVLKVIVKSNLLPFVVFSYSLLHFGSVITAIMLALIFMLQILLISFFRRKIRQR